MHPCNRAHEHAILQADHHLDVLVRLVGLVGSQAEVQDVGLLHTAQERRFIVPPARLRARVVAPRSVRAGEDALRVVQSLDEVGG